MRTLGEIWKLPVRAAVSAADGVAAAMHQMQKMYDTAIDSATNPGQTFGTADHANSGDYWPFSAHNQRPTPGMQPRNHRPDSNNPLDWNSVEALGQIRSGMITAEQYVSALLQRYRESKTLNAYTWIDESRVLENARTVDRGQKQGPLAGLPLAIKDNISTVGFPTSAGTPGLKRFFPQQNALVVDTLFKNGAILFGKANMDELGRGVTTSNQEFGFAQNPYDTKRVPGGGAGGTAVAISTRTTPAGLGSDTAGSARMPASFCGIVGMRPSTAGHPREWVLGSWKVTTALDGVVPITYSITTPAPMGRTVSDVALLNAYVTGTPEPSPLSLWGARIGVPRGFFWEDVASEVLQVAERALDQLRNAGATLIDIDLRQWAQTADQAFFVVATLDGLKDLGDFLTTNGANVTVDQVHDAVLSKDVRARLENIKAHPIPLDQATQGMNLRRTLLLQYEDVFRTNDIQAIVYPTVPVLPPLIRAQGDQPGDSIDLNGKQVNEFNTLLRNTHLAGVVGIPSLSIPSGLSSSGLPVGMSFDGLPYTDSSLLGLGLSVEAVFGHPPAPTSRRSA